MDHVRKYAKIITSRLRRRDKTAGLSVTSWPIAAGEWCYRPLLAILSGLKAEFIDHRLCDETDPLIGPAKALPIQVRGLPHHKPLWDANTAADNHLRQPGRTRHLHLGQHNGAIEFSEGNCKNSDTRSCHKREEFRSPRPFRSICL
jgi:hypothetical protein